MFRCLFRSVSLALCFFYPLFAIDPTIYQPTEQPVLENAQMAGINLGNWTTFGTGQIKSNIFKNPGFEGSLDSILVVVQRVDCCSFSDQINQGQDNDYWIDAVWDVRSGTAAGKTGTIKSSLKIGEGGLPQYFINGDLTGIARDDVIAIRKKFVEPQVIQWWKSPGAENNIRIDTTQKRPGSPGEQSVVIESNEKGVELNFYWDEDTSGLGFKALPVNGRWKLSFWAKGAPMTAESQMPSLIPFFKRLNGTSDFLREVTPITSEWQQFSYEFDANDSGSNEALKFSFFVMGMGKVWIDDVELGKKEDLSQPFRQEVVDMLRIIRPSFIRDWEGQLGDDTANRWETQFGRKNFNLRLNGGGKNAEYGYSIPDVLDLAEQVGSMPWLILPTTLSDADLILMGEKLALYANNTRFAVVNVEFGNENWNALFGPQGIWQPQIHGPVASRAFMLLKQGAGNRVNLNLIVNAQHILPENSILFLNYVPLANMLAIAPYYLHELTNGLPSEENLRLLFKGDEGQWAQTQALVEAAGKKLGIYEINAHTTGGGATSEVRSALVSGQASGTALAKQLIKGILSGSQPQVVFNFVQYAYSPTFGESVRLWGITRDVATGTHFRPTGLALILLNNVIGGNAYGITPQNGGNPNVSGVLFLQQNHWKGALVSASSEPLPIQLLFPDDGTTLPVAKLVLGDGHPFANNEHAEEVFILPGSVIQSGRTISFDIPPYGLVTFF